MARLFVVQFPRTGLFSLEDQEKPFRAFYQRYFKRYDAYVQSVAEGRPNEEIKVTGRFDCLVDVEAEELAFLLKPQAPESKGSDFAFLKMSDLRDLQSPMPEEELRKMAKEVEDNLAKRDEVIHRPSPTVTGRTASETGAAKDGDAAATPRAQPERSSAVPPSPAAPVEQERARSDSMGSRKPRKSDPAVAAGGATPADGAGPAKGAVRVPLFRAESAPTMAADSEHSGHTRPPPVTECSTMAATAAATADDDARSTEGGAALQAGAGDDAAEVHSAADAGAAVEETRALDHMDEEDEKKEAPMNGGDRTPAEPVIPKLELVVDLEQGMRRVLQFLNIHGAVWVTDTGGERFQVTFPSPLHRNEKVLRALQRFGLGHLFGSVTIAPLDIAKMSKEPQDTTDAAEETAKFLASTKSRLVMFDQMVNKVMDGAELSFDFVALVVVASLLAGVGLLSNNTVIIVASMLVSPIMGPVMGVTFGATIREWSMVRTGLVSGMVGVGCCVLIGIILGLVAVGVDVDGIPTDEMVSRGEWIGLPIGLSIAIPSGVGVALSVAGQNTGSLVGVAISASLLPPAVNAGILWSYAVLGRESDDGSVNAGDFAEQGLVSLLLTLLNILCIFVFAMAMFELKELGRIKSATLYWRPEVKLRRSLGVSRAEGHRRREVFLRYLDMLGEKDLVDRLKVDQSLSESKGGQNLLGKDALKSLFVDPEEKEKEMKGMQTPLRVPDASAGVASTARRRMAHRRHNTAHAVGYGKAIDMDAKEEQQAP